MALAHGFSLALLASALGLEEKLCKFCAKQILAATEQLGWELRHAGDQEAEGSLGGIVKLGMEWNSSVTFLIRLARQNLLFSQS